MFNGVSIDQEGLNTPLFFDVFINGYVIYVLLMVEFRLKFTNSA